MPITFAIFSHCLLIGSLLLACLSDARKEKRAGGEVTRVEILEATPRRIFERVVVKTLSQWKFAPGTADRSMEIEIDFHR